MTRQLRIRPEAFADLAEAYAWYERERRGLGNEFLTAAETTFGLLRQAPEAKPLVYREARRALLRRFPYAVYYTLAETMVEVRAVLHTSRHPRRWRSRVREA